MTEISKEILDTVAGARAFQPEVNNTVKHKWLYSVVPSYSDDKGIFLVGFCPNDQAYFSSRLKEPVTINTTLFDRLNIPMENCKPE